MFSIDFWTTENMSMFWGYVQTLLEATAPGVMIWFAIISVGLLLKIVVNAWRSSSKNQKEEEYEYEEY